MFGIYTKCQSNSFLHFSAGEDYIHVQRWVRSSEETNGTISMALPVPGYSGMNIDSDAYSVKYLTFSLYKNKGYPRTSYCLHIMLIYT